MVIEPGVVTAGVVGGRRLTFVRRLKSTAVEHICFPCVTAVFYIIRSSDWVTGWTKERSGFDFWKGRETVLFYKIY
jgi:hypothetical protein